MFLTVFLFLLFPILFLYQDRVGVMKSLRLLSLCGRDRVRCTYVQLKWRVILTWRGKRIFFELIRISFPSSLRCLFPVSSFFPLSFFLTFLLSYFLSFIHSLSTYLVIHLPIYLRIYLRIYSRIYLCIYLRIYTPIHIFVYLFVD